MMNTFRLLCEEYGVDENKMSIAKVREILYDMDIDDVQAVMLTSDLENNWADENMKFDFKDYVDRAFGSNS